MGWDLAVGKLEAVQRLSVSQLACTLAIVPYCWALCACVPVTYYLRAYHTALAAWVAELNLQVLAPAGAFARFQSSTIRGHPHCRASPPAGLALSWLAVATTPGEAAKLEREPMLWAPAGAFPSPLCSPCGRGCVGDGTLVPHPCSPCVCLGVPFVV